MNDLMPSRPSWLHETRILLRLHWRPLLAIVVVTELVSAGVGIAGTLAAIRAVDVFPGLDGTIGVALVFMVPAVLAGMCNAWTWAAVVEVCRSAGAGRRVGVAVALRQGLRPAGPLALWLAGMALLNAVIRAYTFHELLDGYRSRSFQTASAVATISAWYLVFATALLPLVVLVEQRGAGRAWLLAHSRAATAGQIIAVLAFGLAVDYVADLVLTGLRRESGYALPPGLTEVATSVLGVLTITVSMAALMTAYLRRVAPFAATEPEPTPGPAEPVVIELGRTW
ncbi:hypothetical protein [Catellatospora methionotrophica]|uniref:hypothetical protein n=1 Tax=Catellatospora methionotrophica TaxID=121620 RepID=UPI0033C99701